LFPVTNQLFPVIQLRGRGEGWKLRPH
jgi:hypothetical protein